MFDVVFFSPPFSRAMYLNGCGSNSLFLCIFLFMSIELAFHTPLSISSFRSATISHFSPFKEGNKLLGWILVNRLVSLFNLVWSFFYSPLIIVEIKWGISENKVLYENSHGR